MTQNCDHIAGRKPHERGSFRERSKERMRYYGGTTSKRKLVGSEKRAWGIRAPSRRPRSSASLGCGSQSLSGEMAPLLRGGGSWMRGGEIAAIVALLGGAAEGLFTGGSCKDFGPA